MSRFHSALVFAFVAILDHFAYGLTTSLTQQGIVVNAGQGGQFTLAYPALGTATQTEVPSEITIEGRKLSAKYSNGAVLITQLQGDGTMNFHFSALPDDVKKIRFDLPLPLTLNEGGRFAIEKRKAVAFPAAPTADGFLFKGDAKRLVVMPAKGDAFAIDIEHGWQQMQDNRVWNTDTFAWMAMAELPRINGNEAYYTIRLAAPNAPPAKGAAQAAAATPEGLFAVKLGEKEITISTSTAGTFSITYPRLVTRGEKLIPPVQIAKDAGGVSLLYAGGGKGRVRLDQTSLAIAFSDLPADVKQFRMEMLIPINFAGSGTYSIGGAAAQTFPAEKPAKPFLYQGNADRLEIVHPTGPGFSIAIPPYSFQQLQDNRE